MRLLVVVDYQNDFVNGALANEAAVPLEAKIAELCNEFLQNNDRVLFTLDTHEENYLQTREGKFLPVPHCINGSDGHSLTDALLPFTTHENALAVNKPAFGGANIARLSLQLCGMEPQEIHICGVVTDICVVSNAILLHSSFRDAQCVLHEGLCAAGTQEGHDRAVELLRGLGWHVV